MRGSFKSENNFLTTRDKGTCGQILYIVFGRTKSAIVLTVQPSATHVPRARQILHTCCCHLHSCLHYSYHEVRFVDWITLHSTLCGCFFSFFLAQLQLVWVHVCLHAISTSRWCPKQWGVVKYLSRWFNGAFPNVWEQYTIFYQLKLILKNHWSHRPQRVTHTSPHIHIVHIKGCSYLTESDVSGHQGSSHTEGLCKALVCIHRAVVC